MIQIFSSFATDNEERNEKEWTIFSETNLTDSEISFFFWEL